ncbi:MAG TPA: hypothetical protein VF777_01355 [Phycisphaerales bacterium]
MKHIQVIDSAENCSFSICLVSDRDFRTIFPRKGQDIEFIEDLSKRIGKKLAGQIINPSHVPLKQTSPSYNSPKP